MPSPVEFAETLRQRIDIVDVVQGYVRLKQSGANHKGCCPFHQEKTPSFMVSSSKQIFHCFGCGKGGDALKFIMEIEHLTWMEALRFLADKYGIAEPVCLYSERDLFLLLLESGASVLRTLTTTWGNVKGVAVRV